MRRPACSTSKVSSSTARSALRCATDARRDGPALDRHSWGRRAPRAGRHDRLRRAGHRRIAAAAYDNFAPDRDLFPEDGRTRDRRSAPPNIICIASAGVDAYGLQRPPGPRPRTAPAPGRLQVKLQARKSVAAIIDQRSGRAQRYFEAAQRGVGRRRGAGSSTRFRHRAGRGSVPGQPPGAGSARHCRCGPCGLSVKLRSAFRPSGKRFSGDSQRPLAEVGGQQVPARARTLRVVQCHGSSASTHTTPVRAAIGQRQQRAGPWREALHRDGRGAGAPVQRADPGRLVIVAPERLAPGRRNAALGDDDEIETLGDAGVGSIPSASGDRTGDHRPKRACSRPVRRPRPPASLQAGHERAVGNPRPSIGTRPVQRGGCAVPARARAAATRADGGCCDTRTSRIGWAGGGAGEAPPQRKDALQRQRSASVPSALRSRAAGVEHAAIRDCGVVRPRQPRASRPARPDHARDRSGLMRRPSRTGAEPDSITGPGGFPTPTRGWGRPRRVA